MRGAASTGCELPPRPHAARYPRGRAGGGDQKGLMRGRRKLGAPLGKLPLTCWDQNALGPWVLRGASPPPTCPHPRGCARPQPAQLPKMRPRPGGWRGPWPEAWDPGTPERAISSTRAWLPRHAPEILRGQRSAQCIPPPHADQPPGSPARGRDPFPRPTFQRALPPPPPPPRSSLTSRGASPPRRFVTTVPRSSPPAALPCRAVRETRGLGKAPASALRRRNRWSHAAAQGRDSTPFPASRRPRLPPELVSYRRTHQDRNDPGVGAKEVGRVLSGPVWASPGSEEGAPSPSDTSRPLLVTSHSAPLESPAPGTGSVNGYIKEWVCGHLRIK